MSAFCPLWYNNSVKINFGGTTYGFKKYCFRE